MIRYALPLLGATLVAMTSSAHATSPPTATPVDQILSLIVSQADIRTDDRGGQPVLDIQLAPESRQAFARFTTANIGRAVALRADGRLLATPVIRAPIENGSIALDPGVGDYALSLKDMATIVDRLSSGKTRIEVSVQPRQ
jgi:preprotein translocase subunit SecD